MLAMPYWPLLLLSTLFAFIYVAFNGLSVWLTASLFNNILIDFDKLLASQHLVIQENFSLNDQLKYWTNNLILRDTALESLKVLCLTLLFSILIKNISLYIKNISLTYIQYGILKKLSIHLYSHLQHMSLSYFDKNKSGELASIMVNDVSNMRAAVSISFQKLFVEPINILVFICLLFIINIKLALVATIIVPLTGVVIVYIGKSIRRKSKRTSEKIANIMSMMTENLNSIRIVKSFNMEKFETERFISEQKRYYRLLLRRAKLTTFSSPITELIGTTIGVILLWTGSYEVLVNNSMNSEDFIRFILILFSVLGPIRSLSNVSIQLQAGAASADRVFDVLDAPVTIYSKPESKNIKEFKERIVFENVGFNYENSKNILKDVSFNINKGTMMALVGASGAGKSTIADLIPRFYDVISGKISIDGVDIRDIELGSLRNLMGIVSQETILFNDTIGANIKYGLKNISDSKLEQAAKNANALDFILKQTDGFNTQIGERGIRLSGGQKQRLAIARALLRNPPILILDEATSSLDTESEYLVQKAIDALMVQRTVLVIAHRLSTIKKADSIIVMENGQISAVGKHKDLLKENEIYSKLYNKQFSE
tara:strand:+ start:375 stop:2174 length:1800 start_codon:yes stop_codon:yes gene_type:complete